MSILNTLESMAMGNASPENAKVAGGLMDELQQRGGVGSLIQAFERNGMRSSIEQWSRGQTQPPSSTAIDNGTAGTGLIASIAQRTGLSEGTVRGALAVVVPLVIHHMVSNGHITPTGEPRGDQPPPQGILQSILHRL